MKSTPSCSVSNFTTKPLPLCKVLPCLVVLLLSSYPRFKALHRISLSTLHFTFFNSVYVSTFSKQSTGQPGMIDCQSCSYWSAERRIFFSPVPVRAENIGSRKTGSAVPSRVDLLMIYTLARERARVLRKSYKEHIIISVAYRGDR